MDNFGFLKVAAAVPHVRVADCDYNTERMAAMAEEAARRGAPEEDGQTIVFCKIDKLCHSNNRFRKVSWRP